MAKPTHIAYTVREYEVEGKKKGDWLQVGVAFAHKDSKGFDLRLEAMPINGRVTLRVNEPKAAGEDQDAVPEA